MANGVELPVARFKSPKLIVVFLLETFEWIFQWNRDLEERIALQIEFSLTYPLRCQLSGSQPYIW